MSVNNLKTKFQLNETGGKEKIIIRQLSLVDERRQTFGHVTTSEDTEDKISKVQSLSANFEPPQKVKRKLTKAGSVNIEIIPYSDKKEIKNEEVSPPKPTLSDIKSVYEVKGKEKKTKPKLVLVPKERPKRQTSADMEARKAFFLPSTKSASNEVDEAEENTQKLKSISSLKNVFEKNIPPKVKTNKIEVIEKPQQNTMSRRSSTSSSSSSSSEEEEQAEARVKSKHFNEIRSRISGIYERQAQALENNTIPAPPKPSTPPITSSDSGLRKEDTYIVPQDSIDKSVPSSDDVKNTLTKLLGKQIAKSVKEETPSVSSATKYGDDPDEYLPIGEYRIGSSDVEEDQDIDTEPKGYYEPEADY